ncbi:predicted protein [Plenodomus lingam JN3]|uniref:Predicted protein n=1 Tax=Leptosphaeria maculans (strain JN3 / isolate v23.1.3 / race Av1-4-5-6-7-8) TaxID=985895 RepID=E5R5C4_LEPMJ|nr:predicted protein [Plenodomus lingam JN3]CBX92094.1 predicted protein [Plenodomus lingam JN3]
MRRLHRIIITRNVTCKAKAKMWTSKYGKIPITSFPIPGIVLEDKGLVEV